MFLCVKIIIPHYLVSEEGLVANFAKIHIAPKNIDTDISALKKGIFKKVFTQPELKGSMPAIVLPPKKYAI